MRNTFVEIDLSGLLYNFGLVRRLTKGRVIAVVKADAYGHGADIISRYLEEAGVDLFGVAFAFEGVSLRQSGITAPILMIGGISPGDIKEIIDFNLTPVIGNLFILKEIEKEAARRNKICRFHINLDTGMARLGAPLLDAVEIAEYADKSPYLKITGLMTHFAESEIDYSEFTMKQVSYFNDFYLFLKNKNINNDIIRHAANSGAILNYPEAYFDAVRPGLMLYGYYADKKLEIKSPLKKILSFKSEIIDIKRIRKGVTIGYGRSFTAEKELTVALLPVGYADGYFRSNAGNVLINGQKAPICGRVSMDTLVVDISHIPDAAIGSPACLLGKDGLLEISAYDLGEAAGTIPYEILTSISKRVPRRYIYPEIGK